MEFDEKFDENAFFRQSSLHIYSNQDIQTALLNSFDYISSHIPADAMYLFHYDEKLKSLRTIAEAPQSKKPKVSKLTPLPVEFFKNHLTKTGDTGVSVVNVPGTDSISEQFYSDLGVSFTCSVLMMPLRTREDSIGQVAMVLEGSDRYTNEHALRLKLLKEPFMIAMSNTLAHEKARRLKDLLVDDTRYFQQELFRISGDNIIGSEYGLRNVMKMVHQVASLDSPVLLLGETGVGKDVIANAIHYFSTRQNSPFIVVNCGAIPETLVDSELFGYEKGAFTGALSQKRGRFERANEGTIFLDEIGELTPQAQIRLLRVLQHREIERVGGTEAIPVNIRIITATHRNLEEMVKAGKFREDLWFRINVFPIQIPPLRIRTSDIPALVDHFIQRKSKELKLRIVPTLDQKAFDHLKSYHWPGNVRELENIVERALILQKNGVLTFDHLNATQPSDNTMQPILETDNSLSLDAVMEKHISQVLQNTNGKISGKGGAAEILKLHPNTLRHRMKKLGISTISTGGMDNP